MQHNQPVRTLLRSLSNVKTYFEVISNKLDLMMIKSTSGPLQYIECVFQFGSLQYIEWVSKLGPLQYIEWVSQLDPLQYIEWVSQLDPLQYIECVSQLGPLQYTDLCLFTVYKHCFHALVRCKHRPLNEVHNLLTWL